ncbi:putative F-box protein At2g02030 [Salvia hispanica]|uniref:putative F-box protein At2g02030 n=1 Tax=Salvia hispanica TaxID=49212 RepID=UPI002009164B|nr:putative F-box protein At2g02030 [Salvia hispanica]
MEIKNQDPFNDFLPELTIEILSRLPFRTILITKRVCKSWRGLVESPLFALLHSRRQAALSSARAPAIEFSKAHSLLGFIDDNEVIHKPPKGSVLSHSFPNPYKPYIHSSVNGLLFMIDSKSELFISNPITREYVRIEMGHECCSTDYAFGFGVSRSGQYKIVRFYALQPNLRTCQVYNLGIGQWKSITVERQLEFMSQMQNVPPWVNGNLHWLILDLKGRKNPPMIYCLDLETELFNYFSCPPSIQNCERGFYYSISNLGGRLCFTNDESKDVFEIWCMKKYGDDKSWTKDYVIKRKPYMLIFRDILLNYFKFYDHYFGQIPEFSTNDLYLDNPIIQEILLYEHNMLYPVKAFEDGGVLLALHPSARLFYYSNETKDIQQIKKKRNYDDSNLVIHCPNFVSLKSLAMENTRVESF